MDSSPCRSWRGKRTGRSYPKYTEDKIVRDDKTIPTSGKSLLNRIELFSSRDRPPEWYITHKYPLSDNTYAPHGTLPLQYRKSED